MWNHWDNHDERSNKGVEGDNFKMKSFCDAADPQIHKTVGVLRQYEKTDKDKYLNAKKPNARAPSQRPETSIREANFRQGYPSPQPWLSNDFVVTVPETIVIPETTVILETTVVQEGYSNCDICHQVFKTRGLTKHRNSCLIKNP